MAQSVTEWLQQSRLMVVEVDQARGRLRVKGDTGCTDLSCQEGAVVVTDEGTGHDLRALNPGDIVKLEGPPGRPERIVVVRRVWEELASPEL